MTSLPTRRKFVTITAAAAGVGLLPFGVSRGNEQPRMIEWRGVSLGSVATIRIYHPDREAGQRLIERVVAEARRLETIFTLYETDSVLCDLNRRGVLVAPPAELVDVLQQCDRAWHVTGGVFDPTVQPLWNCYYKHFAEAGETSPPSAEALDASDPLFEPSRIPRQINIDHGAQRLKVETFAGCICSDHDADLVFSHHFFERFPLARHAIATLIQTTAACTSVQANCLIRVPRS